MSTLTEFEPFVDSTIRALFVRLDEFVAGRRVCDIAVWMQYCGCRYLSIGEVDAD